MMVARFVFFLMFSAFAGLGGAFAQSLGEARGPAELPPPGYAGSQYVDSRGCVFIRAGFGGNVVWVPRVSLNREQICGQPPGNRALAGASGPRAPGAAGGGAPVAAPVVVVEYGSVPYRSVPMHNVSARPVAQGLPAAAVRSAVPVRPLTPVHSVMGEPVRPAWSDDRLNPNRGPRTALGDAQMDRIWTRSVPRRLIEPATGAAGVSRDGVVTLGELLMSSKTPPANVAAAIAAAPAPRGETSTEYFVQLGTYGVEANARNTALWVRSAGFEPVLRRSERGAVVLRSVLAGPIVGRAALERFLEAAREAGYRDAFVRR